MSRTREEKGENEEDAVNVMNGFLLVVMEDSFQHLCHLLILRGIRT